MYIKLLKKEKSKNQSGANAIVKRCVLSSALNWVNRTTGSNWTEPQSSLKLA